MGGRAGGRSVGIEVYDACIHINAWLVGCMDRCMDGCVDGGIEGWRDVVTIVQVGSH